MESTPLEEDARHALEEWTALFNQGHYFAAHEALERPWLRAQEPVKTFLKALIHAAVSLYQYGRGNGHGARVKYASFARYLEASRSAWALTDLDVPALQDAMDQFMAPLLALPSGGSPPPPTRPWPRAQRLPSPTVPVGER